MLFLLQKCVPSLCPELVFNLDSRSLLVVVVTYIPTHTHVDYIRRESLFSRVSKLSECIKWLICGHFRQKLSRERGRHQVCTVCSRTNTANWCLITFIHCLNPSSIEHGYYTLLWNSSAVSSCLWPHAAGKLYCRPISLRRDALRSAPGGCLSGCL